MQPARAHFQTVLKTLNGIAGLAENPGFSLGNFLLQIIATVISHLNQFSE